MSEEKKAKKKGGKGKKLIILGAAVLLLGGGGTAAGFYVTGGMGHSEKEPKVDPNQPQLVPAGKTAEEVAAEYGYTSGGEGSEGGHGGGSGGVHAPSAPGKAHGKGIDLPTPKNPTAYTATYFQLPAPFTSNLSDSDAFAQISIAVSTYYDKRVTDSITSHEMAIRSAVLMMLAEQSEFALSTPEGKEQLQAKLKSVINGVLKDKTGYGGVDNVYFTNFVIQ